MERSGRRNIGDAVMRLKKNKAKLEERAAAQDKPKPEVGNLCITRCVGEAFWVQGGIRVEVTMIDRRKVKLSIRAPKGLGIVREELMIEDPE